MKHFKQEDIPKMMSHLPLDDRGYPVPYFVNKDPKTGEIQWPIMSAVKHERCVRENRCGICGKKLLNKQYFFISGPKGFANKVCSDPPMHSQCAEFSLKACPHMFFRKAERREGLHEKFDGTYDPPGFDPKKPEVIILIKSDKFKGVKTADSLLIQFRPVSHIVYRYNGDGILERSDTKLKIE